MFTEQCPFGLVTRPPTETDRRCPGRT